MTKKKLITSSLPYVNGIKHIGNLIGSILPADISARYFRQQGKKVLFICGTDEHGTPSELGALNSNLSVDKYCLYNHELQKKMYKQFNISFDYFGRTSSLTNHSFTQKIFSLIKKNGYVFSKTIKQFYSILDKRFLPDRYIEGKCAICDYKYARGDQCDCCGSLIDPITGLINPYSTLSKSNKLKLYSRKHLFFNLPKLKKNISEWINNYVECTNTVKGIINKWLKKDKLQPRCITRDLSWGVKVNDKCFSSKVFYVWFDAVLAYISITKDWSIFSGSKNLWELWWRYPDKVDLIQFMAKDNVVFHAIFWPAIMMATGEKWVLPNYIKGMNWLTYEGEKFSTSKNIGIFIDDALGLFSVDYWRYALFCMIPENQDSSFSFLKMADAINKDLANNLGNFINRVLILISKRYKGVLPSGFYMDDSLKKSILSELKVFDSNMRNFEFRKSGYSIKRIWDIGNKYLNFHEPWLIKNHFSIEVINVLKNCLWLFNIYSCVIYPIVPDISFRIRSILFNDIDQYSLPPHAKKELDNNDWLNNVVFINTLQKNILIKKITEKEVKNLTDRFSNNLNNK